MTKQTNKHKETAEEQFRGFASAKFDSALIPNLPDEVYFDKSTGYLSKHTLELLLDCPQKYKAYIDGVMEDKKTDAMEFGSALHCAVLTPSLFAASYVAAPDIDKRTKAGKEAWSAFQEQNAGKTIIPADWFDKINGMKESLKANGVIDSLLFDGREDNAEITALTRLPDGKIVKAKIDKVCDLGDEIILVDLKTAASANPKDFARACANFRYDMQGAIYQWLYSRTQQIKDVKVAKRLIKFAIVAIEKEPPYSCAIFFLDEWLEAGFKMFSNSLAALREAEETGIYEGYSCPDDILPVPAWHK